MRGGRSRGFKGRTTLEDGGTRNTRNNVYTLHLTILHRERRARHTWASARVIVDVKQDRERTERRRPFPAWLVALSSGWWADGWFPISPLVSMFSQRAVATASSIQTRRPVPRRWLFPSVHHAQWRYHRTSVHFASFPLCPRTFFTIVVYSRRLISPSNTFFRTVAIFFNATFTFFRQTRHTITISTISSTRTRYRPLMALTAWDTQYKLESSHLWFNEVEESFKHLRIRRSIIINNRREFSFGVYRNFREFCDWRGLAFSVWLEEAS